MKEYFELQYRMTNRQFKDTGFEPLFAYLILTVGFIGLSIYLFNKTEFAVYVYLLFALTLIGKLSETRRTEFLKICFGDTQLKKIRITENLICSIPFFAFLLYKQLFLFAGLLLVLTTILALVNFRTTLNFTIWTPFSKRPFEFTTGFRNTFYLFIVAYALTFIAVSVNNFNLGVFAMLLVFATTLSYYTKPENEYYVWTYNQSPRQFLLSKIKTAILFSFSLAFPIALALSIIFYQNIGLILLFILVGWAFLTAIIVTKYSAYPDEMTIPQGILLAICLWFPPILLVLIPYLFQKSENQLSSLLK
ncbi:MAG: ABC transporter permease [Bacteroidetes bacterium]|nr:ABC transporter permease [Bacteroidota bacterium]